MNEELNQINDDFQENINETASQPVFETYEERLTPREPEKKEPQKNVPLPLILSGISLLGTIVLFCLFFFGNNKKESTVHPAAAKDGAVMMSGSSDMRIAFVDTDSILQKYALVEESKKSMEKLHVAKQQQFQNAQAKLEADYNAYIQTGASLTLQQQQEKENELTQRGAQLQQMEEQFMTEINEQLLAKNKVTADSVINFIKRYNKGQKYTLILEKSGVNGVLYGESSMDITSDILNGLNAEYEASKKK